MQSLLCSRSVRFAYADRSASVLNTASHFLKSSLLVLLQEKRVVALKLATRGAALPGMLTKPPFL